jgi:hypothetical protein
VFEFGGGIEIAQVRTGSEDELNIALAADAGVSWMPPLPLANRFSLTGRYTSGKADSGPLSAFRPITGSRYGNILKTEIPGLSIIGLDYTIRLHEKFSTSLNGSYFIRSDKGTYMAYPVTVDAQEKHFLGGEFYGRFMWSPVSDLSLNLGGGVFIPYIGNVAPDVDPRWRVELSAVFALH